MGLVEDVKEVKEWKEEQDKKKKTKKFRLPFGKAVGKKQAKKNWITILKLNENGNADFSKQRIEDQAVMVDGVPRLATAETTFIFKNKPIMILPSWSVVPLNKKDMIENSFKDGTNVKGYKVILAKMISSVATPEKKKIGGMIGWIIGLGILGLIGYAIFSSGGKIF